DEAHSAPGVLASDRAGREDDGEDDAERADDLERIRNSARQEERLTQVDAREAVLLAEAGNATGGAPEDRVEEDDEADEDEREHPRHHSSSQLEELRVEQAVHQLISSPVRSRNTLSSSVSQGDSSERRMPCRASTPFSSAARATGADARR